jgi:predicted nucleic acid-binding protein
LPNTGALYREWRQKGLTLALPHLTIAAVAITNGLDLATDNPKDFTMPDLRFYLLPSAEGLGEDH